MSLNNNSAILFLSPLRIAFLSVHWSVPPINSLLKSLISLVIPQILQKRIICNIPNIIEMTAINISKSSMLFIH